MKPVFCVLGGGEAGLTCIPRRVLARTTVGVFEPQPGFCGNGLAVSYEGDWRP